MIGFGVEDRLKYHLDPRRRVGFAERLLDYHSPPQTCLHLWGRPKHAAAPITFYFVKGHVRSRHYSQRRCVVGQVPGEANRSRQVDLRAGDHKRPAHLVNEVRRYVSQRSPITIDQHQGREFVAAQPGNQLAFHTRSLKPLGRLNQDRVACRMSESIINRLEAIEIDHCHAGRHCAIRRLFDIVFETFGECAPVRQPSKRISIGKRFHL